MPDISVEFTLDQDAKKMKVKFTNKEIIIGSRILDNLTKFFEKTLDYKNQGRYNEMFESEEFQESIN